MAGSFDRAFGRLVRAFGRYHAVPREPERFDDLSSARIELDDARADTRAHGVRFRTAPENDEFVEPGIGTDPNTVAGKVAAAVFVVVIAVAGVALFRSIRGAFDTPLDIVPGSVEHALAASGDRCVWTVNADLRNGTGDDIEIESAGLTTRFGSARFVGDRFVVPADSTLAVAMPFLLLRTCPEAVDDTMSGQIRFNEDFSAGL